VREEITSAPAVPRRKRRPPLGAQVLLGLGGLLALVVLSIMVAMIMVVTVKHDETSLSDRDVPYASAIATAALNAKGIANDQRGFLLTGDQMFIDEAEQRTGEARTAFAAGQNAASSSVQREAIGRARAGFEDWVQAVYDEFATFRVGNHKAAIAASLGPERELRKSYEQSLANAQALGERSIRSASNSATATSSRSLLVLVVTLVAAVVIGSVVVYWLVHSIAFPLFRLATLLTTPS
jgi:methyl-accepting chemotaxis protein